jgi:EamA domain-containing membrane protein RarD
MMAKVKAFIDAHLERFMSRKLLVWLTTTGLLFADKLNGEQWIAVSLGYIGVQGIADIAARWRSTGKGE